MIIFILGIVFGYLLNIYINYFLKSLNINYHKANYPLVIIINIILWFIIIQNNEFTINSLLYCLLTSLLIIITIIDFKSFEIPQLITLSILVLAIIKLFFNISNIFDYLLGFFIVSFYILFLIILSKGKAIGGGDFKLMASAGLFLGYKLIILAFIIGIISASIIHSIKVIFFKANKVLAFGPYLSIGIYLSLNYGNFLINWYLSLFNM